jgi:hypothetical protein
MGHTYPKNVFVVDLSFKFNQHPLFLCANSNNYLVQILLAEDSWHMVNSATLGMTEFCSGVPEDKRQEKEATLCSGEHGKRALRAAWAENTQGTHTPKAGNFTLAHFCSLNSYFDSEKWVFLFTLGLTGDRSPNPV